MKIGILGAGGIAVSMANTVNGMADAELYAIGSRSLEKSEAFAEKYGCKKAYGSYEELVSDPDVDIIYIATPHSHHFEHASLAMKHKKHVLCEKAFTVNVEQAEELFRIAREQHVVITEAIWTRYMPSRKVINDLLESGVIGEVSTLTANLSYKINQNARIVDPNLAGGALLDVGVYPINFALMHFGTEIDHVASSCQLTNLGVDGQDAITIYYKDGRMANLTAGIYARSDRHGIFYGSKGYMVVDNINDVMNIDIYDMEDKLVQHIDLPEQITGYEYEVQELMETIQAGKTECPSMPHADTLYVMKFMDEIRDGWGIKYPFE